MKVYILIQMLVLLLYTTANSTIITDDNCEQECSWVEVSTKTWVQTFTTQTKVSETTEEYTYRPVKEKPKTSRREGPSNSYICYVLLNGGNYGNYSVEPRVGSDIQTLYNDGKEVRQCNFQDSSLGSSRSTISRAQKTDSGWGQVNTQWTRVVEGGYWLESEGGYWDCSPAPVPEPATMLLFGAGLVGLTGFYRRKK